MALVDTIQLVPSTQATKLKIILTSLVPPLVAAADPTAGVWWLVMSQPGRSGNYFESSGTAMFTYALLKGIRKGYINDSDGSILAAAKKAYKYMTDNWVVETGDGTFDWLNTASVGSLSGAGDYDVYVLITRPLHTLNYL
jgi:rhamnogalacturonyl hydrolase YesR